MNCFTLEDGPLGRNETSLNNCQHTLHDIPEELIFYLHRSGSLKARDH